MTKAEEKQRLRAVMRQLERELPERYKQTADRAIAALDCGAYVVGEIVSGGEKVTLC